MLPATYVLIGEKADRQAVPCLVGIESLRNFPPKVLSSCYCLQVPAPWPTGFWQFYSSPSSPCTGNCSLYIMAILKRACFFGLHYHFLAQATSLSTEHPKVRVNTSLFWTIKKIFFKKILPATREISGIVNSDLWLP